MPLEPGAIHIAPRPARAERCDGRDFPRGQRSSAMVADRSRRTEPAECRNLRRSGQWRVLFRQRRYDSGLPLVRKHASGNVQGPIRADGAAMAGIMATVSTAAMAALAMPASADTVEASVVEGMAAGSVEGMAAAVAVTADDPAIARLTGFPAGGRPTMRAAQLTPSYG